uniref:Transmembrane protein n=1 Tax=Medicago truncatula TaxID=3880 RepID=I3SY27_MEDTR|nr:unknown [Medicago truncatula]
MSSSWVDLLFFFATNLFFCFLSLIFQTLFLLNTNLSTFHTGQLVSITVTSLFVKPLKSSSPSSPSTPRFSTSTAASTPVAAGALAVVVEIIVEEGMKILGFVCFLGHFFEVMVAAPGLKR